MPSSTSSSERRGLAPVLRGLLGTLALLAVWHALVVPRLPEDPERKQHIVGKVWEPPTPLPYHAYRPPEEARVLVIGSSRVDSGIVEAELEAEGLGTTVVFTGPGGQLLDLLGWVRDLPPRRLIVSLDPLAIYSETHPELLARAADGPPPLARRVDEALGEFTRRWHERLFHPIDTEHWQVAWFRPMQPRISDLPFQRRLAQETRRQRRQNARALGEELAALADAGWQVVCIRIPLAPSLLRIEDNGCKPETYLEIAEAAGAPFLDYSDSPYETYDGSHLAAWEARRFSRDLARDLVQRCGW